MLHFIQSYSRDAMKYVVFIDDEDKSLHTYSWQDYKILSKDRRLPNAVGVYFVRASNILTERQIKARVRRTGKPYIGLQGIIISDVSGQGKIEYYGVRYTKSGEESWVSPKLAGKYCILATSAPNGYSYFKVHKDIGVNYTLQLTLINSKTQHGFTVARCLNEELALTDPVSSNSSKTIFNLLREVYGS